MKEFYENLKKKRKEKGISLEEIHQKSRLALGYLKAIEAGEVEKLPEGYERIYIKRYAKEIGLDDEEVLRDFDLMSGRIKQPEPPPPPKEPKKPLVLGDEDPLPAALPQPGSPAKRRVFENLNLDRVHRVFWVGLAAIVLIGAAYFTYRQYMIQKEKQNLEITEITIPKMLETLQPPPETPKVQFSGDSSRFINMTPRLIVELRALERIWIREIIDSRDTTDFILTAGLRRSVEAVQQVQLLLGRADGVEIWLNGNNLGIVGKKEQVAYLLLTEEGIAQQRLRNVTAQKAPPAVSGDASADSLN